ncbi:MAG: hypothetical protein JWN93_650 [Hyphomicrobiales bacterium]|nr:hypothetical protein [Hyphomicrobiales bacterium]
MINFKCVAVVGAALALSACGSRSVPTFRTSAPAATGQADNKVWARNDGQRMSGNPALLQQGKSDLAECRTLSEVGVRSGKYDLQALSECMGRRGYREVSA